VEPEDEFLCSRMQVASDHDGIGRVGEQPDAIRSAFTSRTTSRVPSAAQLGRPSPDRPLGDLDLGVVPNMEAGGLGVRLNDPERVRGTPSASSDKTAPRFDDRPFVGLALNLQRDSGYRCLRTSRSCPSAEPTSPPARPRRP